MLACQRLSRNYLFLSFAGTMFSVLNFSATSLGTLFDGSRIVLEFFAPLFYGCPHGGRRLSTFLFVTSPSCEDLHYPLFLAVIPHLVTASGTSDRDAFRIQVIPPSDSEDQMIRRPLYRLLDT